MYPLEIRDFLQIGINGKTPSENLARNTIIPGIETMVKNYRAAKSKLSIRRHERAPATDERMPKRQKVGSSSLQRQAPKQRVDKGTQTKPLSLRSARNEGHDTLLNIPQPVASSGAGLRRVAREDVEGERNFDNVAGARQMICYFLHI